MDEYQKLLLVKRHCSLRVMPHDRRYEEAMSRIELTYIKVNGETITKHPKYARILEVFETEKIY